jgi:excinuclease ABC subunit B
MPVNERIIYRFEYVGSTIDSIVSIDPITRTITDTQLKDVFIYPAKHFISDKEQADKAFKTIQAELEERLAELIKAGKNLEAERLKRRVKYDLALIREVGYCTGIENYSRHFSQKKAGEAPDTLLSYFPHLPDGTPDFLTVIDESHVTVPQIGGNQNALALQVS